MQSSELKAFYMVARLGSITLAAKKLGLSQPTVTTQIRNLEAQYAVELFYRGGRRLVLSEEGVRLLPMVKALLQQEADIEFELRNSGQAQLAASAGNARRLPGRYRCLVATAGGCTPGAPRAGHRPAGGGGTP